MKKLMFASLAVLGSVAFVNAQDATPAPAPAPAENAAVAPDQEDKAKIKSEELPEAVKKALEAQEYRGWLINGATHVKSTDTYEVELKNGAETKMVKFSKDGKVAE
jgi:predicted aconitase